MKQQIEKNIEKNKQILWEEMEKLGSSKPMNPDILSRLVLYRNAYKALSMLCEEAPQLEEHRTHSEHHQALTKDAALEWTCHMKNEDGTTGPHWTMEQTEQVRKQRGIECDQLEFYVAMNMMYSDYCKAAEKANASNVDLYAYMAKAFLDDKDAKPHKLARYYHHIAEK